MKKLIKVVDALTNTVQITTADERWYVKGKDFVPSVTWICGYYPKGIGFMKWLASKGWDEAEAIKSAAGDKGSKVHYAVEDILNGVEVKMNDKYVNPSTGQEEELSVEEYECLMSLVDWYNEVKPVVLRTEITGFGDGFAGTIDLICKIDGQLYIVDFKTGQYIWAEHYLQLSAYKRLEIKGIDLKDAKLAILQLNYRMNKKRFKFTELEDKFPLFLAAKEIWANETADIVPLQKDYPMALKLDLTKVE